MRALRAAILVLSLMLVSLGLGCSYVVEFDRSLLLDAGVDGGDTDSGFAPVSQPTDDAPAEAQQAADGEARADEP